MLVIPIIIALTIIFIAGIFFLIQGPPNISSDDEGMLQMISIIKDNKPELILDMGSGDGKLVIALAKEGFRVDGVELNPLLVIRSKKAIKKAGLENLAKIRWGNFWTFNTSKYDTVVVYMIQHVMPRLEKKLKKELKKGSLVISNYFTFPELKPLHEKSRARAYKF